MKMQSRWLIRAALLCTTPLTLTETVSNALMVSWRPPVDGPQLTAQGNASLSYAAHNSASKTWEMRTSSSLEGRDGEISLLQSSDDDDDDEKPEGSAHEGHGGHENHAGNEGTDTSSSDESSDEGAKQEEKHEEGKGSHATNKKAYHSKIAHKSKIKDSGSHKLLLTPEAQSEFIRGNMEKAEEQSVSLNA